MDITTVPPSTILSNHSHHLYHPLPLLPSALSRNTHSGTTPFRRHPRIANYEPSPPLNDSSPLSDLPDELLLEVFKYLDWKQLLPIQRTCRRFNNLTKSGSLYHTLTLSIIPPIPLPPTIKAILPNIKHLHLNLLSYPSTSSGPTKSIRNLLDSIQPNQLVSLSLPFSAPYLSPVSLGRVVGRLGGRLEKLDLRGSGVSGKGWLEWIEGVGLHGEGLKELDLGFTNITELSILPLSQVVEEPGSTIDRPPTPPPEPEPLASHPFRNLTTLSLASCTSLSPSTIYTFLSNIPPTLAKLDISRLEQTSFEALKNMPVIHRTATGEMKPTALGEIKVIGIDHLTRLDIRKLNHHWESQRDSCDPLVFDMYDEPSPRSRVWGEPRTHTSTTPEIGINLNHMFTPPMTPDSLPRLSSSYGSSSEPSSLGSISSLGRMAGSPRLLTPDTSIRSSPDYGRFKKHPFLADLKGQGQSTPIPISIPFARRETPQDETVNGIKILHSAILESEDEAGYRQFIGEVAGGTVGLGHGYGGGQGHELGMRWINN